MNGFNDGIAYTALRYYSGKPGEKKFELRFRAGQARERWIAMDVIPKETDSVEVYCSAVFALNKLLGITGRIDDETTWGLPKQRNPAKTTRYLYSLL